MAMQHLENELRRTDDPRKRAFADVIVAIHKSLGTDIPLHSVATPETPVEIKRFSKEQRKALKEQGFVIYGLTGRSIKSLRDSGCKLWSDWHKSFRDFEALGSMRSEVAINPNELFLPKSNNKTLAQQEEMVEKFSQELGKKVEDVEAIIGQAPDYIELAFKHLRATKKYLFGAEYNYHFARTKTPTSSSDVARVGHFGANGGLFVHFWRADDGVEDMHAVPLVVPV